MSEQTKPDLILVAGGGARVESSSVMYTFMRETADEEGLRYRCVDGTHDDAEKGLLVSPASYQLKLIEAHLQDIPPERRVLIVSQCLGTVASLTAMETALADNRSVRLLTISPPLPNPYTTLQAPRSVSKRMNGTMKTWDLPADGSMSINEADMTLRIATVPPAYEQEHFVAAGSFKARLRDAVEQGYAMAVATEADWNKEAHGQMRKWGGYVMELPDTGHSLNPSYGYQIDYSELLAGQRANAATVLRSALSLFDQ